MLKLLTFIVLVVFVWWRVSDFLWRRRLRPRGQEIPEQKGPRPVALLAGLLLAVYGGVMLWHLFGTVSGDS